MVVAAAVWTCAGGTAHAQTPPMTFTFEPSVARSTVRVDAGPVVAERGLQMWTGASDFGIGVDVTGPRWAVRSIESMTTLQVAGRERPTFQQIEIVRPLVVRPSTTVSAGGGLRQEWDGTRVLLARAVAAAAVAGGRLQGSIVLGHASGGSTVRRDTADLITTAGWTRSIGRRLGVGIEGIGQDLEGFWDPTEAEGGARLLVGPTIAVRSKTGEWSATGTVGPVLRSVSMVDGTARQAAGRRFGAFAAATWSPRSR